MAVTFGKSLCRLHDLQAPALMMTKDVDPKSTGKDALAHYQQSLERRGQTKSKKKVAPTPENAFKEKFAELKKAADQEAAEILKLLYTLGIGLGMRESTGNYTEGWDVEAGSKRPAEQAEAGLFQSALNASQKSPELKSLYAEYRRNPRRCFTQIFAEGVEDERRSLLGMGEGAVFQDFAKKCPAFATEYAMLTLRFVRAHYGPINRIKAELIEPCFDMLTYVEDIINNAKRAACSELL